MNPLILRRDETFFLLVDLQERLMPAIAQGDKVVQEARRLLEVAKALEIPVIATEQYPKGLGRTVEPLLQVLPPDMPFLAKTAFSCFGAEGLEAALAELGRRQVVIFGAESHICVFNTAMEFLRRGYETVLVLEACGSRNPEHHRLAMKNLNQAGAAAVPLETVAYQLMERAGTPEFKALLPLFK